MLYKVVFGHWINEDEPAVEAGGLAAIRAAKEQKDAFLVEAPDELGAWRYAKPFEGLETNAHEGLADIIFVARATLAEAENLQHLSIYEEGLRLIQEYARKFLARLNSGPS